MNNINEGNLQRLPMVPLRGEVIFPNTAMTVELGRERSVHALEAVMDDERRLFLVPQKEMSVEHPGEEDVHSIGTVVTVRQVVPASNGTLKVLVSGEARARLLGIVETPDYQEAEIEIYPAEKDIPVTENEKAAMSVCVKLCESILSHRDANMSEFLHALKGEADLAVFADVAGSAVLRDFKTRVELLSVMDAHVRLEMLLCFLSEELSFGALEEKIQQRVQQYMEKANHEYYLREQIHAIQDELGEDEDEEVAELRKQIAASKMPKEVRERVEKELKRLARTTAQAPESAISTNYIEYMLEMPWEIKTKDNTNIKKAAKVLEDDHFGLKEVKERLIEFLAVRMHTDNLKSPILCLVGPPGVGKTSIARSIAGALNRKFVQMSLGGVHDEAEIRGHRKTYVGAMPGRIVSALHQVKTMNPVFLLDEIDKMTHDMRGDPSSALLEALDPEQNHAFRDHYLEAPFNLRDVLFITTANSISTIDRALLDRMEVIEISGYTLEEKVQIAKRHLLPKQLKAHGLTKTQMHVGDKTFAAMIDAYTREAGVRTLERTIEKLCRKVTLKLMTDETLKSVTVKPADLKEYLGAPIFLRQKTQEKATVGVVNGLAWTQVGGEVMPVEAVAFPGKGGVEITGQLGDVMKESVQIAKSVARAYFARLGLQDDYFQTHDLHIHVPEGAVPKDGPSAGVALTCAVVSAITGMPADNSVAMTGEITLHGTVLPIGGVKEKLLAAYRMGIKDILLPAENEKDLEKLDEDVLKDMNITTIKNTEEALVRVLPGFGKENI